MKKVILFLPLLVLFVACGEKSASEETEKVDLKTFKDKKILIQKHFLN